MDAPRPGHSSIQSFHFSIQSFFGAFSGHCCIESHALASSTWHAPPPRHIAPSAEAALDVQPNASSQRQPLTWPRVCGRSLEPHNPKKRRERRNPRHISTTGPAWKGSGTFPSVWSSVLGRCRALASCSFSSTKSGSMSRTETRTSESIGIIS